MSSTSAEKVRSSRRQFLGSVSAAAGAAIFAGRLGTARAAAPESVKVTAGTDLVTLGKSGIKTTVLGIGTGTRGGSEQRALGEEGFVRLVRHAFDRGIRYIDTADSYKMHALVRAALKQLPRDKLFIQTKSFARTAEAVKADIERLRKELDIETADTMLIHCMTKKGWPTDMRPVIDVLLEAKRKDWVRAVGVSCHSLDALKDAADCEEMQVHLVRINPFNSVMDGSHEEVAVQVKKMHEKGRGVIGMKIYGEGSLKTRQERLASLKYVLGLGAVDAFTIGFKQPEQIDETLELIKEATASEKTAG